VHSVGLVYCAATVVPAQKPIGANPRQLSAIGLNYIDPVLSGTRRLKPRECMRECDILSCISEPKQNRTRARREWNKYKYYQNKSGLTHQSHPNRLVMGPQSLLCELLAHKQDPPDVVIVGVSQSVSQSVSLPVCLGLLPRMAAVPSDNAHAATPHHLRNKGPHASAQSPAHHTSWTHRRIHALLPPYE